MSYSVAITVTSCQGNKAISGASISDGVNTTKTTDKNGQATFEVVNSVDQDGNPDPDLPDQVRISADGYGPLFATVNPPPDGPSSVAFCLQPYSDQPGQNPSLQKPSAPTLKAQPSTMTTDASILVSWTSPQSYDKYLIWWTYQGAPQGGHFPQGEVDNTGTSGSWTATPVSPGYTYIFQVEGGNKNFWGILKSVYSGWGPSSRIEGPANLTTLKGYLQASGVSLPQNMRSLMAPQTSLSKFMKLS